MAVFTDPDLRYRAGNYGKRFTSMLLDEASTLKSRRDVWPCSEFSMLMASKPVYNACHIIIPTH